MPKFSNALALRVIAPALALGVLLGGCSDIYYDRRDMIGLTTGDARASNDVTQMVDPWPKDSANRDIVSNGAKMQTAVERYRTNRVIPPTNATTSSTAYQQAQQSANAASNSAPTTSNSPPPPAVK
ncbi:MAG: hypothetical protein WCI56_03955 [Hyphomicrobiales bacterium]